MVKLDYYTSKSQIANYISVLPIVLMFCFIGTPILTIRITASWFMALVSTNIFVAQEKNNLERMYSSLSIDVKTIIIGRYIFIFSTFIISLIISLFVSFSFSAFQNTLIHLQEITTALFVSILVFLQLLVCKFQSTSDIGIQKQKLCL